MQSTAINRDARWMPWVFVAGMLIVVAVNGVLIFAAVGTWSGLAVERPYERGLGYNRALAAAERQEALGWAIKAEIDSGPSGARLVIEASDRDRRPLDDLRIDAVLERPLGPRETQKVELRKIAAGRYAASLPAMARGQWQARIAASNGGDTVLLSQRLTVQ